MSREAHVPFCERLRGQFPRPTHPVVDQLKNISQIEHSRHRSQLGFLLEVAAGLIAYTFQPKKPSLNLRDNEIAIFKRS